MTLLYGKAANGNYYPVQVDDSGRIVAIYGQDALVRPDLTAEFKSIILDDIANKGGPGLGYFEQGSFTPRLASCNTGGTVITPGSVSYLYTAGVYQIVGNRLSFNFFINTSSVNGLAGQAILVDGIPKPAGAVVNPSFFHLGIEYIVGYNWTEPYLPVIQGYSAPGANGYGFMLNSLSPAVGYPNYLSPAKLSQTEVILYAHGEVWL